MIYQKNISNYDYVIIGSGITGNYLAYRLKNIFPNSKILIVEKESHCGGRIMSKSNGSNNIAYEYGAMRIDPEIHKRVDYLVKLFNLKYILVDVERPENVYYLRNKPFTYGTLFPNTDTVYNITEKEKKENLYKIIENRIKEVFKKYKVKKNFYSNYNYRKKIFSNKNLTSYNFHNMLSNGLTPLSNENYERFIDISGYGHRLGPKLQFLTGSINYLIFNKVKSDQNFIKGGIVQIPEKLVSKFEKFNNFNDYIINKKKNNSLIFNTSFQSFIKDKDNIIVNLKCEKSNKKYKVLTSKLFICIDNVCLNNIESFNYDYKNKIINNLTVNSAIKFFLKYNKNQWWKEMGFKSGHCVTTLPCSQVWFYDENTIMIYAMSDAAIFWANYIPYYKQNDFLKISNIKNKNIKFIINQIIELLKKMFEIYNENNIIDLPDEISWNYCYNTSSVWNTLNYKEFKKKSTTELMNDIIYPYGKEGNIYYLNNDVSLNQGWMEGGLEVVDDFILDNYKVKPFVKI